VFKLFDRYIFKEILAPFFVGLFAYTFVLLMNQILVVSELFIERDIPLQVVLILLVYLIPAMLSFSLPMSVLLGILSGLSRMSSDIEITALKTLGVSYKRLVRPLLVFAFCIWILASYMSLYTAPHANHKWMQTFFNSVLSKVQLRINPREFNENIPKTMLFVQDVMLDNTWKNIIVYFSEPLEEPEIVYAKSARINFYPEQKTAYLEMFNGVRHSFPLSNPEENYRIFSFDFLQKNIEVGSFFQDFSETKSIREKDIEELSADVLVIREELNQFSPSETDSIEYRQKKGFTPYTRSRSIKRYLFPLHVLFLLFLHCHLEHPPKRGDVQVVSLSVLVLLSSIMF